MLILDRSRRAAPQDRPAAAAQAAQAAQAPRRRGAPPGDARS